MKNRSFFPLPEKHQITFLGPVNIYLTFWTLFPLLYMSYLSFTNWKIPNPIRFIGFDNYLTAINDPLFRYSIIATLSFAFIVSIIELVLGFIVALLLNENTVFARITRPLMIVPMVLTPIVTAMMWRFMLNPSFGPMNNMLGLIGLGPYEWLSDKGMVWISLIMVDVWQWMPFPALLVLSGLTSLPREINEAAEVDGASYWQRLISITIPMMRPLLLAAFLLRFLDALKTFDSIFVLTRGGPGTTTELLSFHIYRTGLGQFFKVGYGASLSIIVLLLALTMSLIAYRFMLDENL